MPHPLLHLMAGQPHLLFEHLEAYVDLVGAEAAHASAGWKRGAMLSGAALCLLLLGLIFTGVAVMLWAVVPLAQMPQPWALLAAPLVPLVLAVGCLLGARSPAGNGAFEHLRRQLKADMALMREADPS